MRKKNEEQQLRLMAEAIPILRYVTETYFDRECGAAKDIEDLIARIKQVLDEAGVLYMPFSDTYNPWNDPFADPANLPNAWHTIPWRPKI